jgi:hypothetical protein
MKRTFKFALQINGNCDVGQWHVRRVEAAAAPGYAY